MGYTARLDTEDRNTSGATLVQRQPGMKMLLGDDARFEWQLATPEKGDASDRKLVLRGAQATLPIDDARAIIAACETLGLISWIDTGLCNRPGSYRIHGNCPGAPTKGGVFIEPGLNIPQDFEHIAQPVEVSNFYICVSAATFRDVIAPQQKALAIGA